MLKACRTRTSSPSSRTTSPWTRWTSYIRAEIPGKDEPALREIILRNNLHGPCGIDNPSCPCMVEGRCTKNFPKAPAEQTFIDDRGYANFRRRCEETVIVDKGKKQRPVTDRDVVPYNAFLTQKYDCHVNVDLCSTNHCVLYFFKYINKGEDRVMNVVVEAGVPVDEIKDYVNDRYLSSSASAWRIYEFPLHDRFPAVQPLGIHLEDTDIVIYDTKDPEKALHDTTELTRYLNRPRGEVFDDLTYTAYYETFIEQLRPGNDSFPHPDGRHHIKPRTGRPIVTRIHWVIMLSKLCTRAN